MSGCKCPKSDVPKREEQCPPYFEDITSKMEERRCDLVGRHKYLREKITTMERSIPALIAYNMWMAKKCDDAPYCKVRQIMKKFAPYPDQTEKLLANLRRTVQELNGETEELHEKIIQTDVKLEEAEMELESVELANKEMNDALNNLEREVRRYTTPSLHSIHSEDVLCLTKIRQLAEEELSLKHCIRDLEKKEMLFKEHMDRLLTCKEYQNACTRGKPICHAQDLNCTAKRMCCMPKKCLWHEPAVEKKEQHIEDVIVQTEADAATSTEAAIKKQDRATKAKASSGTVAKCKPSWMNWFKNNNNNNNSAEESEVKKKADLTTKAEKSITEPSSPPESEAKVEQKKTSEKASKESQSKSVQCRHPCFDAKDLQRALKSCVGQYLPPCNIPCKKPLKDCSHRKALCEMPRCVIADHGIRLGCKPPLPCDLRGPCEVCPSMPCKDFCRPVGNCRCNCKGKCALGLSNAECNCSDDLLDPLEQYQPTGSKQLADLRREESNSDDEFCECCSCGCEDSDEGATCQCN